MDSSQASALIWCYCNSLQVSVVFSLFGTGLNGKHVEKLAVLLEGRKINREERLPSSLCTPPSSMRCQEKFRSVTQRRQGSSVHTNTLATPPPHTHPRERTHLVSFCGVGGEDHYHRLYVRQAQGEKGWNGGSHR